MNTINKAFISIFFALLVTLACTADRIVSDLDLRGSYSVPDSEMVWGTVTNLSILNPFESVNVSLRAGIRSKKLIVDNKNFSSTNHGGVSIYLENVYGRPIWTTPSVTNNGVVTHETRKDEYVSFIFLPSEPERFAVNMTDSSGHSVPMTKLGTSLSAPRLSGKKWGHWDKDGRQCLTLLSHADNELFMFEPIKYFSIERSGTYNLTLVQNLYVIGTNNLLEAISLPPVTIAVKVEDSVR